MQENQELSNKRIIRKLWTFSDQSHVVAIPPAILRKLHLDEEEDVYFEVKVTEDRCILFQPCRLVV
jgi:hypothetical protein